MSKKLLGEFKVRPTDKWYDVIKPLRLSEVSCGAVETTISRIREYVLETSISVSFRSDKNHLPEDTEVAYRQLRSVLYREPLHLLRMLDSAVRGGDRGEALRLISKLQDELSETDRK